MTAERLTELMTNDDLGSNWHGDNAFQGLQIIAKYIDPNKTDIITGASHDVIYSVSIISIIKAGITEEDVIKLKKLNWMLEDADYLACFV
jgi:hypothetical protein